MSPGETRIMKALQARPMTAAQLIPAVHVSESRLRYLLRRLHSAGVVRPGKQAPRVNRHGASPRYWEAA